MTSFQSNKSFIDSFKAFEDNISVRSCLNYTYSLTGGKGKDIKDEPLTAKVTRSIILLDTIPYRPRLMDSRIGIFPTMKNEYSAAKQTTRSIYYANRWRLEPSDLRGYIEGKKVTPIKPIVFYVDSCFPESWKASIFEAVNQWNEPFEKIGFTQAIQAKEFPKDDPEFDPDNLKYSCIRYAPIGIENAMGPSWVDPRSGEILNASVYLYHNVIKLLNNWLFIQTAQADKRVRHKVIPREVMDDALRYVVSHEVGHCLGFMHNMSASSVIPVDSLRSPSFTQKHGTTTSIMDYARFNYVAQPGDMERGVRMMPPYFGLYDDYLIRWNYTPVPEAKTPEEEYAITSKWITDLSDNPVYRYGKQQSDILDPRSQTEDLGDDAVKATRYGVKNLKYILANLNQWLGEEDVDYTHRSDIYDGIIMQYLTYMLHVYHNIGGIYLHEKLVGDKVEALQVEPKEKQKEAMNYFLEQLATLDWLDDENVLKVLPMVGKPSDALRDVMMKLLMKAPARVEFSALKAGKEEGYDVDECMNDIYRAREESMVVTCDDIMLPIHAADRRMSRNPGESNASYRKRIAWYIEIKRLGGTNIGVERAIKALGYANPLLVRAVDLLGDENRWAEFYVLLENDIDFIEPVAFEVLRNTVRQIKYSGAKDNYLFRYYITLNELTEQLFARYLSLIHISEPTRPY